MTSVVDLGISREHFCFFFLLWKWGWLWPRTMLIISGWWGSADSPWVILHLWYNLHNNVLTSCQQFFWYGLLPWMTLQSADQRKPYSTKPGIIQRCILSIYGKYNGLAKNAAILFTIWNRKSTLNSLLTFSVDFAEISSFLQSRFLDCGDIYKPWHHETK